MNKRKINRLVGKTNDFFLRNFRVLLAFLALLIAIVAIVYNIHVYFDIERTDSYGNTPLMIAVKNADIASVASLLNRGAFVDKSDNMGDTPLLFAARSDLEEMVKILIDAGADISMEDNRKSTPLILAALSNNNVTVKRLVEKGAQINISNEIGQRPFTAALANNNAEMVSFLVENGADIVVQSIRNLPAGSIVTDIESSWGFREADGYRGRHLRTSPISWIVLDHGHYGEDLTLLWSSEILAKRHFDSTAGQWGGRDTWHNSHLRKWLREFFWSRLSATFKNAVELTVTKTSGFVIQDETIFIFSQEELGLGREKIEKDHGKTVAYFKYPYSQMGELLGVSWNYWTRSADYTAGGRYRVRYVHPGGEIDSEYPIRTSMGIKPAANVHSDTLISTYKVDGNFIFLAGDLKLIEKYLD